jgi:glycosyltransferase involved in cell wall biosynthesis
LKKAKGGSFANLRIVYLNTLGNVGGAEQALADSIRALHASEKKYDIHLITGGDGWLVDRIKRCEIPVTVIPFPQSLKILGETGFRSGQRKPSQLFKTLLQLLSALPAGIGYALRLKRVLKELNPDVVHATGFKMHMFSAFAKPQKARLVWHFHDYLGARPLISRILSLLEFRCDAIISNSKSVAEDAKNIFRNVPITTIYNAIDLKEFQSDGPKLDLDLLSSLPRTDKTVVRVGLLGGFAYWKGHRVFLDAIVLLKNASQSVRFYIIGDSIYDTGQSQLSLRELKEYATEKGLKDLVGFTGFVSDPASAIRALDILVHASTEPEPFGLVVIQAMACGCPVIVSKAGGVLEIISEGENAVGHSSGNAKELAECIQTLIVDESKRKKLATAGKSRAQEFSSDQNSFALDSFYNSMLSQV